MNRKSLLALLLVVCMTLSSCALVTVNQDVDDATPIVTVGEKVYTKAEVKTYVDNYLTQLANSYYQNYGYTVDTTSEEIISSAQDEVINSLIEEEMLTLKSEEMGLTELTDEEKAEIEENWQSYYDLFSGILSSQVSEEELDTHVRYYIYNYTGCASVEDMQRSAVLQKVYDEVVKDVAVTEEEVQAEFDARVESAKTSYESNLSSYGTAVNNGSTVYYRPAGYRMVKNLLIQMKDEDQDLIDGLNKKANAQRSEATSKLTALSAYENVDIDALTAQVNVVVTEVETTPVPTAEPTVEPTPVPTAEPTEEPAETAEPAEGEAAADEAEPTEEPTAAPTAVPVVIPELAAVATDTFEATEDETQQAINQLVREYMAARVLGEEYERLAKDATEQAYANIDAEADEVLAKLSEGGDWNELMAAYTDDPGMRSGATAENGYAVCEGFSSFDSAFVEAAMAIENVGEWSDKTRGSYGYYIIQYASEVAEGPVALDDVRETVESSVLTQKQNTCYNETLAQWVAESGAIIDKKALND